MTQKDAQAVILNLGDGLTTSTCYLLPMVLGNGVFAGKALLLGALGGATSMAFNLKNSELGKGTFIEFILALLSSFVGGILAVLPFIFFNKPIAALLAPILVFCGVCVIIFTERAAGTPLRKAVRETAETIIPAFLIVGLLSWYA